VDKAAAAGSGTSVIDRLRPPLARYAGRFGFKWEQSYRGAAEQVGRMRADLRPVLHGCPAADDAELLLSELAANAVRHTRSGQDGGTFTVRVWGIPGKWLIGEVEDGGSDWDGNLRASARNASGLNIVIALSAARGVEPRGPAAGHIVWFLMPDGAVGPEVEGG
jgi:hypothetical protein